MKRHSVGTISDFIVKKRVQFESLFEIDLSYAGGTLRRQKSMGFVLEGRQEVLAPKSQLKRWINIWLSTNASNFGSGAGLIIQVMEKLSTSLSTINSLTPTLSSPIQLPSSLSPQSPLSIYPNNYIPKSYLSFPFHINVLLIMMQSLTQLDQFSEVTQISQLIYQISVIDHTLLHYFNYQYIPEPKYIFMTIIKRSIPHRKDKQEESIKILSYCFYRLLLMDVDRNQMEKIGDCFQEYLKVTPFMPDIVRYHEEARLWAKKVRKGKDLVLARRELSSILEGIDRSNQVKLDIMAWRLQMCEFILDIVLKKIALQRPRVVKLMKSYNRLKKQSKITFSATIKAFCFIISELLRIQNDTYSFFELQLKQLKKQPLSEQDYNLIEDSLQKCQQFNTCTMVNAVHNYVKLNIPKNQPIERKKKTGRTLYLNQDISQKIFRKMDLMLKIKPKQNQSHSLSVDKTSRPSINMKINQNTKTYISMHETTRLGWFRSHERSRKDQSRVSITRTGAFSRRKRKEVYKVINKDKETETSAIGRMNLMDQMAQIGLVVEQRCKLSLQQILLGQITNNQDNELLQSARRVGSLEDKDYGSVKLTFFTIFNQQMAQITIKITKIIKKYILECQVNSTYCRNSAKLGTDANHLKRQITIQDLQIFVQNSIIYYQAIQQRVQRKINLKELQTFQSMLRLTLSKELSQQQLLKILFAVDLVKSQFFWYYTKCSFVNGSRIQKRRDIKLEDQSAFAVCLSKFKSDYDSCLNQLREVENMTSLIQNCDYLSHGRMVVYREFRRVQGRLILEVTNVSKQVYKSVKRRGKVPYFQNTWLERQYIDLQRGRSKKIKANRLNLRQFLKQEDVFIFFMKNIVQNFIEIKYVRKFSAFLSYKYQKQNINILEKLNQRSNSEQHIEVFNNSEIFQTEDVKDSLPGPISHFRDTIMTYSEAYKLKALFQIQSQKGQLFKVGKITFFGEEITLKNGIKLIKYHKSKSKNSYSIYLYHQTPKKLSYHLTPFYNRLAFLDSGLMAVNLVRNYLPQKYQINDTQSYSKMPVRIGKLYCYASIGESECLLFWKLHLYIPNSQTYFATFLGEELFLQCMNLYKTTGKLMWRQALGHSQLDLTHGIIVINKRTFRLFQVHREMIISSGNKLLGVEFVEFEHQLHYLITNYKEGVLSLGRIDDIPFAYSSQLLSPGFSKSKPGIYRNLMIRLWHQIQAGLAPSDPILPQNFEQK